MEKPTLPVPGEGISSYYRSQIPLSHLRTQFTDYATFFHFTPPARDAGLSPLFGLAKDTELCVTGAQTRIGLGLAPLLSLHQDAPTDRRIADAILAVTQGISQLDYFRRFLALTTLWGDSDAAKQVLRHAADTKSFAPDDAFLLGKQLTSSLTTFSSAPDNPLKLKKSDKAAYRFPTKVYSPSFYQKRLAPYQSVKIPYFKSGNKNYFSHYNNQIQNRMKSVYKIRGAQKSTPLSQNDRCPEGPRIPEFLVAQKSTIYDPKNCDLNNNKIPDSGKAPKSKNISRSDRCPKGPSIPAHPVAQTSNIIDPNNCDQSRIPNSKGKTKSTHRFFLGVAPYGAKPSGLGRFDQGPAGAVLGQGDFTGTSRGTSSTSYGGEVSIGKEPRGPPRYNGSGVSRPTNCSRVPVTKISGGPFPSTQTGGQIQTNNRSVTIEQVPTQGTLQDGKSSDSSGVTRAGRVHVQSRSEECLLQHSNRPRVSAISCLSLEREDLDVHETLLRPEPGPSNFHKSDETCTEIHEVHGDQNSRLHRRLLDLSPRQDGMQATDSPAHTSFGVSGVHCEPREEHCKPSENINFPGDGDLLPINDNNSPDKKERFNSEHDQVNDQPEESLSESNGKPTGEIRVDKTSVPDDCSVLQRIATMVDKPFEIGRTIDKPISSTGGATFGVTVLDGIVTTPETSKNQGVQRHGAQISDRCQSVGLGNQGWPSCSLREVDERRILPPHKCPRTFGDLQGAAELCIIPKRDESGCLWGQHNQPSLHPKEGRHSQQNDDQNHNTNLGISPGKQHKPGSRTCPRGGQPGSRSPVPSISDKLDGEHRMDAKQESVHICEQAVWTIEERSVRQPLECTTNEFLLVESSTPPNECVPPSMDGRGLCFPTIHTDGEGLEEDPQGPVHSNTDSTKVGIPELVPNPSGNALQEPSSTTDPQGSTTRPEEQPSSSGIGSQPDGMACLRKRLKVEGLSKEATDNVLEAWMPETARKYESAWKLWKNFCSSKEFDHNPDQINMIHVAEFLSAQIDRGVSFTMINAYTSALSAFLPKPLVGSICDNNTIKKLKARAFKANPPRARYEYTWNVDPVIEFWDQENDILSLREIAIKAFTLLKIATMGRDADIRNMSAKHSVWSHIEGSEEPLFVDIWRIAPGKGDLLRGKKQAIKPCRVYALPPDMSRICPVRTCKFYMQQTEAIRDKDTDHLFISNRPPHKKVQPKTVANWVKFSMEKAGVNTSVYKSHSMCGAALSTNVWKGASLDHIIKNGRWKNDSTLKKWYLRHFMP